MEHHRQCEMRKPAKDGPVGIRVAWIPEKFAVKGKWLKLKINGQWEDHWQVTAVYARQETREVYDRSRDHLKQRKASDV